MAVHCNRHFWMNPQIPVYGAPRILINLMLCAQRPFLKNGMHLERGEEACSPSD